MRVRRRWAGNWLLQEAACLALSARGESLEQAMARAYQALAEIDFEGMYYRRDIGHRALKGRS